MEGCYQYCLLKVDLEDLLTIQGQNRQNSSEQIYHLGKIDASVIT